jgi:hypothetical protein
VLERDEVERSDGLEHERRLERGRAAAGDVRSR